MEVTACVHFLYVRSAYFHMCVVHMEICTTHIWRAGLQVHTVSHAGRQCHSAGLAGRRLGAAGAAAA